MVRRRVDSLGGMGARTRGEASRGDEVVERKEREYGDGKRDLLLRTSFRVRAPSGDCEKSPNST